MGLYVYKGLHFFIGLFQLEMGRNHERNRVSVIIAARNEEKMIGQCIQALLRQTYPEEKYEIIIVDDQSTDQTSTVVESYVQSNRNVRLIRVRQSKENWSRKKYALAMGIDKSSGDILLTTDADCIVGPRWIEGMIKDFEPDVGLVVGYSQVGFPRKKRLLFDQLQATDFFALMCAAAGTIGRKAPLAASGQNLAYRRSAFQAVGGFEKIKNRVSGDDVLLLQLIVRETDWKVRFSISPETFVTTHPVRTLREFFSQRKRWASNSAYQRKLNRGFFAFLLATFTLNLLLCVTLAAFLFGGHIGPIPWICLLTKVSLDAIVLIKGASLFQRRDLLKYVPLWEILHIPLTIAAGILGALGRFTWKERTYAQRELI
jgi:cellulose synthase/poly-beta-1,6-N-acetylglucosamine synthase-like glycosyltransferase